MLTGVCFQKFAKVRTAGAEDNLLNKLEQIKLIFTKDNNNNKIDLM